MVFLFPLAPELGHILEGLALSFGNELPDEYSCHNTEDAIESVGEPVAEVIAFRQVHVEHGHERRGYDEIGYPLEGNGNGDGTATDGVGEDLGDEYPADGAP